MHRRKLLQLLAEYEPNDAAQWKIKARFVDFVQAHDRCFERSLAVGHITGAAWLLNRAGTRALLTHHRKLNKWLQPGGHADGQSDILAVALREAQEESGLCAVEPVDEGIFDLDVHLIPAHADVPAHLHYDVRFLVRSRGGDGLRVSHESHDLRWVSPAAVPAMNTDESVLRLSRKWLARTGPPAHV